ncbi:MAG: N-acetylmuramoyl-L-alanine amidase [Saprospiraceae bacterium]|nr:N-acetylmuramoyl-L-alanine amidase [Saprospiraceae bacterium]MDW8483680.1 N-acetylmuramoyl-L-alanine amidase [Saprospiraceae bacterium]
MKKPLLCASAVVLIAWNGICQGQRATVSIPFLAPSVREIAYSIPLSAVNPFLAWSVIWHGEAEALHVRFSPDGRSWSDPWAVVNTDAHASEEQLRGRWVSNLQFESEKMRYFQVRTQAEVRDVVFHFYSPGASAPVEPSSQPEALPCPCPKPPYLKRQDWCPAGNCPPYPNPLYTTVTHIVIHHSATSNTANDWAAVVRAIWDFHVNTNGWADIGYNWLIDPNGVLYEGRADNVIGAHFCGKNAATMGVCLIGDFTNQMPTTAAQNRLRDLIGWKLCTMGDRPLDSALHVPSGLVLPRVCGHRDGCSTACPGNTFYPTLPNVRTSIANYIAQVCSAASIADQKKGELLHIFPNPVRHTLLVQCPETSGAWLHLVRIDGRLAQAPQWFSAGGRYSVDVAHLPSGFYHLYLIGINGQRWHSSFLKL